MDLKNEPRSPEPIVPIQVVQNMNIVISDDGHMPKLMDSYPSMQHTPIEMGTVVDNVLVENSNTGGIMQMILQNQEHLAFDSNSHLTNDGNLVAYSMFPNLSEEMTSMAADYMDCSESFSNNGLLPHLQTEQMPKVKTLLPKKFKCAMCAYRTRYKSDLNRHVRKHSVASYNCDICNMPFKTSGNVEFHKRKQHGAAIAKPVVPIKYKCKYCHYDTLYSSDLTRHIRKHGVAKFHCGMCNRPFMTSGSLVHHKQTYHNLENLEIVMGLGGMETVMQGSTVGGDSNFSNNSGKIQENPVMCNGIENSEVIDLTDDDENGNKNEEEENRINSMIETVHGGEQFNNISVEEGAEGSSVDDVERQDPDPEPEIHSDPQPVPEHEKRLLSKISGVATQTYKCPHCDKTFGRKLVLEFHLRSFHQMKKTAQKIWRKTADDSQSNIKEDTFAENATVTTKHTQDVSKRMTGMRHKCPYCSYGTMYKSTYDRHVKKHEFACYLCSLCNMPFITLGHLLKHKRQTHPDYPSDLFEGEDAIELGCPHCDFCAKDSGQLRLHCDSTHRMGHPRYMSQQSPINSTVATNDNKDIGSEVTMDVQTQKADTPVERRTAAPKINCPTPPQQRTLLEDRVAICPPRSGRYAKLISDYDQFAEKPFACSLCFFRTADVQVLVCHVANHLSGCNNEAVPETARIMIPPSFSSDAVQMAAMQDTDLTQMLRDIAYPSQSAVPLPCPCAVVKCQQHDKGYQSSGVSACDVASRQTPRLAVEPSNTPKNQTPAQKLSNNKNITRNFCVPISEKVQMDSIVPTFSVHYRKDRNKRAKPYICLMCKKRFSHLVLLKQHFKMIHSNLTSKIYQCTDCSKLFNDPMLLQEHYDTMHKL